MQTKKLYIVTRADLSAGAQAAQIAHATADFIIHHPDIAQDWHCTSNTIVILETETLEELKQLTTISHKDGILHTPFYEPDFEHELTAVAFTPTLQTSQFLSHLPLLGRRKMHPHTQKQLVTRESILRQQSRAVV